MSKDIYQIIKDLDKVTNPVRITKKTLQELSLKAGLQTDAYKEKDAKFEIFQTIKIV